MQHVDEEQCLRYGLDPKAVASIAKRLSRAGKEAQSLGLKVFGAAGSGQLRFMDGGDGMSDYHTSVADLEGHFDGGDS